MSNEKPRTISVSENAQVETAVRQSSGNEDRATKGPLIPSAADLPVGAEPAMEQTTAVPDDDEEEPAGGEIAGSGALAEALAPESPKKVDTGMDEIMEAFRGDTAEHSIDAAAEDSDVDLETNQVITGPTRGRELVDLMVKLYSDPQKYSAAQNDPKSFLNQIKAAIDHGWGTTTGSDIEEVLKSNDTFKKLHVQTDTDKFPGIKDGRPNRISHKTVEMVGEDAILAIKARMGGIVRVNLLNSGFWVGMRSPEISELQEIFATIDFENREIGRILGGHFALIADLYLKQKFIDLLIKKKIIIQSNFGDIYKKGRFARNIAYHDYDTLLHGVIMLMTRGGLRYNCICPHCGKSSIETLDVSACKFVNEDLWTDKVREWWTNTTDINGKPIVQTEQSLLKYRTEILAYKRTYDVKIPSGVGSEVRAEMDFVEPTLQSYFDTGSMLIANLNETINNISEGNQDKAALVQPTLALHHYQQIAPWITAIRIFEDDGTTINTSTTDPRAIMSFLDELNQHDGAVTKALVEFIRESRFNWIGTHSIRCPQCGARPTSSMENFYPLEIQTIFFGLLSRLWQSGR
jgi:hypothetical protein